MKNDDDRAALDEALDDDERAARADICAALDEAVDDDRADIFDALESYYKVCEDIRIIGTVWLHKMRPHKYAMEIGEDIETLTTRCTVWLSNFPDYMLNATRDQIKNHEQTVRRLEITYTHLSQRIDVFLCESRRPLKKAKMIIDVDSESD